MKIREKAWRTTRFEVGTIGEGNYHWSVEDAADDGGVVIAYHEKSKEGKVQTRSSMHVGAPPDVLLQLADAIKEIALEQKAEGP